MNESNLPNKSSSRYGRVFRALLWAVGLILGFAIYTIGIGSNPPGFFIDESANAYNAFLVATTGAGEVGGKFPLYFRFYSDLWVQWGNPTQIYLLAAVFWLFGPSIVIARIVAAACAFGACILMGRLAYRISGRMAIGVIVGGTALLNPWLFEVGRLVLDPFFYPMATVMFVSAVFTAQKKDRWTFWNILFIVVSLGLLTYSYTIGRLLAPVLALGLAIFITNRKRLASVLFTWLGYAVTLIPLLIFAKEHPDLSNRFYLISYIKRTSGIGEIIGKFIPRFLDELNPWTLLSTGDTIPRHHMPGTFGSILLATFILALIGTVVIFAKRLSIRWWLFIVYGFLASIVPCALTVDHAHTLRMIAYPIFLFTLMIPAIEWMLSPILDPKTKIIEIDRTENLDDEDLPQEAAPDGSDRLPHSGWIGSVLRPKMIALIMLIGLTLLQSGYFYAKYYNEGAERGTDFDVGYKQLYDLAVAQPQRPIYLLDDSLGPSYIHALWYSTLEGRDQSEFVHLRFGEKPQPGSLVLSTQPDCVNCEKIAANEKGILYISREANEIP